MKKRKFKINGKKALYLVIPLIIVWGILCLCPCNRRQIIGGGILTSIAIPIIYKIIEKVFLDKELKVNPDKIALLVLIIVGVSVPSLAAVVDLEGVFPDNEIKQSEKAIEDESFDEDFIIEVEETDAIEVVVKDIDDSVFNLFYLFSYVRDGNVITNPECGEEDKIQEIADQIVKYIEISGLEQKRDNYEELNSGKYSELTKLANKAENEYKSVRSLQDKQKNISNIKYFLDLRLDAYEECATDTLARLIGNTYAELSTHQVVNDNIISNCMAIKYYIECCRLSEPNEKSKMFYEIGVRFNRIAEISNSIYLQEQSQEYRELYIDSLYMSSAYYKLFQTSFIEDYKSNFYLARNYKMLGERFSDSRKIMYLENALEILYTLQDYPDITKKSRVSIYNTIHNILTEYQKTSNVYWNRYNSSILQERLENVLNLKNTLSN